jgi:hypothetical protein
MSHYRNTTVTPLTPSPSLTITITHCCYTLTPILRKSTLSLLSNTIIVTHYHHYTLLLQSNTHIVKIDTITAL